MKSKVYVTLLKFRITVFLNRGRSTVLLNGEDYLEKCMDHINNGPYQSIKNVPTTKISTRTLKQLKALKVKKLIYNKLYYYLKPTDSPAPRFYGHTKNTLPGDYIRPIVSYSGSALYNLKKYITIKDEHSNTSSSTSFSNYIRNVPIK